MRWPCLRRSWQHVESFLPGSFASLAIISLLKLGAWQSLESLVYTALFQLRGAEAWDQRVVVVTIDEPSLKALGRFPWSRQRYTELLGILTQAEASTVVLNVLLPESSPDDPALAKAIAQQGRVVLAQAWDAMGTPLLPHPVLRQSAAASGHIYQQQDEDGLTRQIESQVQGVPALGLAATQIYSLVQEPIPIPVLSQPLWLNWSGSISEVPTYSFLNVLQQKVPVEQLRGKIVLVGMTATGFDPLRTPFNQNPPTTNVYLHATLINNLLQQNFLNVLPETWVYIGLLFAGPSLSFVLLRWSPWQQLAVLAALCLGWSVISFLVFRGGYWIPVASPIALLVTTTTAVIFGQHLKSNFVLQREIDRLWQTYRSDLVIQTAAVAEAEERSPSALVLPPSLMQMSKLAALAEQFGRSQSAQSAVARSVSIGLVAADLEGLIWFCNPIAAVYLQVQVGDRLSEQLIPHWLSQAQWQINLAKLTPELTPKLTPKSTPKLTPELTPDKLDADRSQGVSPILPWEVQQGDRWFELKVEPVYRPQFFISPSGSQTQENAKDLRSKIAKPEGLLLVIEEITQRKQVEKNLQQQMQALQQLSQLKDDFLSTVSHELRTPMTNMKMAIQMLQLATSEDRRTRYLQILEKECTREISLINDLLDLQRLEAEPKTTDAAEICLEEWLIQILEPFYQRASARQQTLYLQLAPNLPSLLTDSSRLRRVMTELVNNACKYTPPSGKIEVSVEAVFPDANPYIAFRVTNSGSEIPAAELGKIFDKFYRVSSGDRWQQGGTGLGLALVKKLVEHLGGTIQVTSHSGQTLFTVNIPIAP